MAALRLQSLQWIGSVVAVVTCVAFGGTLFVLALNDFHRADEGIANLVTFDAALAIAAAVSVERGPSNAAMGPAPGSVGGERRGLQDARAATDRTMSALEGLFGDDPVRAAAGRSRLAALRSTLDRARRSVDAVVTSAVPGRRPASLVEPISLMFEAADAAIKLRDWIGRDVIEHSPALLGDILTQVEAGDFRENAGRAGSYVVLMLGASDADKSSLAERFDVTAAKLRNSWDRLSGFSERSGGAGVGRAIAEVRDRFFGQSWPIAEALSRASAGDRISPAEFTRLYVSGLDSVREVHARLAAAVRGRIEDARQAAVIKMAVSACLATAIAFALLILDAAIRRHVFRPLLTVRRELLAIAGGDLGERAAKGPMVREIAGMFDALDVLRDHQRQRHTLEIEQTRLAAELRRLSETDTLTGLMNRRAMLQAADRLVGDRAAGSIALILFDIDHFKLVNDTFGHAAGDELLRSIADTIAPTLRPADVAGRLGGEEFAVMLAGADLPEAVERARLLSEAIGRINVGAAAAKVTCSFGVAAPEPGEVPSWSVLFADADRRLYRAKRLGRDRVCWEDEPLQPPLLASAS